MSELDIQIVKSEIKGLTEEQARDIAIMYYKRYIEGLDRGHFDIYINTVRLLKWLKNKNKITLQQHKIVEPTIKVQEVIDKIKELM